MFIATVAQKAFAEKGLEFVVQNKHIRDKHEQFLKILVIKEQQRVKASILIQKMVTFHLFVFNNNNDNNCNCNCNCKINHIFIFFEITDAQFGNFLN